MWAHGHVGAWRVGTVGAGGRMRCPKPPQLSAHTPLGEPSPAQLWNEDTGPHSLRPAAWNSGVDVTKGVNQILWRARLRSGCPKQRLGVEAELEDQPRNRGRLPAAAVQGQCPLSCGSVQGGRQTPPGLSGRGRNLPQASLLRGLAGCSARHLVTVPPVLTMRMSSLRVVGVWCLGGEGGWACWGNAYGEREATGAGA